MGGTMWRVWVGGGERDEAMIMGWLEKERERDHTHIERERERKERRAQRLWAVDCRLATQRVTHTGRRLAIHAG